MGASAPQDGDIVVREHMQDGKLTFVLHTEPGPAQMILRTRDEALQQANKVAERLRVQVWIANGGSTFVLVKDCRKKQAP
jgi:hypothetical protein